MVGSAATSAPEAVTVTPVACAMSLSSHVSEVPCSAHPFAAAGQLSVARTLRRLTLLALGTSSCEHQKICEGERVKL